MSLFTCCILITLPVVVGFCLLLFVYGHYMFSASNTVPTNKNVFLHMKIIEINGNLLLGYVLTVNLQHINENVTKILYVFVQ